MEQQAKATRTRAQIETRDTWRLEDIFETDEAWENAFAALAARVEAFAALEPRVAQGKEGLREVLTAVDELDRLASELYAYARMRRDEDNRVTRYQAMADRAESLYVKLGAAAAFVQPAVLALPEDFLRACIADPLFADADVFLRNILRDKPHTLPAEQERLLAMSSAVTSTPSTIYDMLTDADLKYPEILDSEGNKHQMTQQRYITLLLNADRTLRKNAFEAMMALHETHGNTIAATMSASVKAADYFAKARHFGSTLEAALHPDEIPASVYDNLINAVHGHLPALNRYLAMRAPLLKIDRPHHYDLYVNLVPAFDLPFTYAQAYEAVIEATRVLGEGYTRMLETARDNRWVDVYENEGKSGGAYSWGTYSAHPYILMSFEEGLHSTSTLAHELGHALHSHYSAKAQPHSKSNYSLFAAEVASTVNEILLSCSLLEKHSDRDAQAYIIGSLLEEFRGTVFRQTMFAEFERAMHTMHERGESLTKESISQQYIDINRAYYGEACEIDDAIRNEWMRIPHFYRNFYVYKYSTGFSAAASIARRILAEGAPAVEGYMRFLSAGGSLPPIEALKLAGVDMGSPKPIAEALAWFAELVERFGALMGA